MPRTSVTRVETSVFGVLGAQAPCDASLYVTTLVVLRAGASAWTSASPASLPARSTRGVRKISAELCAISSMMALATPPKSVQSSAGRGRAAA
jgi:hypothetical protein